VPHREVGQFDLFDFLFGIIWQTELAGRGGLKKRTRAIDVRFRHLDFDGAEPIDGKAMCFAQGLAPDCHGNARRLEKSANLLRLDLAAGHEHATTSCHESFKGV
jgi:hypothetical protein